MHINSENLIKFTENADSNKLRPNLLVAHRELAHKIEIETERKRNHPISEQISNLFNRAL